MTTRLLLLALFCAVQLPAATVLRVDCGGPGDRGFDGGVPWTSADQPGIPMSLRYAPVLNYSLPLPTGLYIAKLSFYEPNKTAPGQRVFSVAVNGVTVAPALDLFASAGLGKPYVLTVPLTVAANGLRIKLVASAGNAVISAIQVDEVAGPPEASGSWCEFGYGDGAGPLFSIFGALPPAHIKGCWNASKAPRTITSLRCWTDGTQQNTVDLMVPGPGGALVSALEQPLVCDTGDPAIVAALPSMVQGVNKPLDFFVRIAPPEPPQQSPSQVQWVVTFQ